MDLCLEAAFKDSRQRVRLCREAQRRVDQRASHRNFLLLAIAAPRIIDRPTVDRYGLFTITSHDSLNEWIRRNSFRSGQNSAADLLTKHAGSLLRSGETSDSDAGGRQ
jgi:hypothetical protein